MTHKGPSQQLLETTTTNNIPGTGSSHDETMTLKGQQPQQQDSYSNNDLGGNDSGSEHDAQSICSSQSQTSTPIFLDVDLSSIHSNEHDGGSMECSSAAAAAAALSDQEEIETKETHSSFLVFRLNYLLVTMVIMLSDGLQGKSVAT
jgi:hypothetical protein